MNKMKLPSLIFIIIINIVFVILPSVTYTSELEKGRCYLMTPPSGHCLLEMNGTTYEISTKGVIKYNLPKGVTKLIRLILPEFFYIEAVNAYNFSNDILFSFEISNDDEGSTILALLNKDFGLINWTADLNAFNPSPPLVVADSIYIGAIGTIAKIDAKTGRIIWKHTGLYERTGAFNSFLKPLKQGEMILFKEDKSSSVKYKGIREIWVKDKSGEIVRK